MSEIEEQIIEEIGPRCCNYTTLTEKFGEEVLSNMLQDFDSPVFLFGIQSGLYFTTVEWIIKEGHNFLADCDLTSLETLIEKLKKQYPKEKEIINKIKTFLDEEF